MYKWDSVLGRTDDEFFQNICNKLSHKGNTTRNGTGTRNLPRPNAGRKPQLVGNRDPSQGTQGGRLQRETSSPSHKDGKKNVLEKYQRK